MERSQLIYERVSRDLKHFGILDAEIGKSTIYDEISNGQIDIYSKIYITPSSDNPKVDDQIDPLLPSDWDKALEYYSLSQLVPPSERAFYINLYDKEIKDKKGLPRRNNAPLQRGRV